MATITQNGILFNNIKTAGVRTDTWPIYLGGNQQGPDEDGGVINAVDIDWNGADFTNAPGTDTPTTINTTGQLIDAIKWASKKGNTPSYIVVESNGGQVTLDGSYDIILVKLSGSVSGIIFNSSSTDDGKECHVIFTSETGEDLNVLINGSENLILPDGESELSLLVPGNGYAEINFLNISNILYVRGI